MDRSATGERLYPPGILLQVSGEKPPDVIPSRSFTCLSGGALGDIISQRNNGKTEGARSSWECHSGGENFLPVAYDHLQGSWEHQLDESPGLTAEGTVPPKSTRWQSGERRTWDNPRSGEDTQGHQGSLFHKLPTTPENHGRWRETVLQCLRLFFHTLFKLI